MTRIEHGSVAGSVTGLLLWSVRMGGSFDQSPVTNSTHTVRIPDANRWLLAFGAGWGPIDGLTLDLGYLHIFFADGTVNETLNQFANPSARGKYTRGRET